MDREDDGSGRLVGKGAVGDGAAGRSKRRKGDAIGEGLSGRELGLHR